MKTTNKTTTTSKTLETRNAEKQAFEAFKKAQALKVAEVEKAKIEAREARKTRSNHFNLKNNVLAIILRNSLKGKPTLVSTLMASTPINCGEKTAFNINTINRDWNVKSPLQAEETRLNEAGIFVGFEVETLEATPKQAEILGNTKHNNSIKVAVGLETLKAYLLSKNAPAEMFEI